MFWTIHLPNRWVLTLKSAYRGDGLTDLVYAIDYDSHSRKSGDAKSFRRYGRDLITATPEDDINTEYDKFLASEQFERWYDEKLPSAKAKAKKELESKRIDPTERRITSRANNILEKVLLAEIQSNITAGQSDITPGRIFSVCLDIIKNESDRAAVLSEQSYQLRLLAEYNGTPEAKRRTGSTSLLSIEEIETSVFQVKVTRPGERILPHLISKKQSELEKKQAEAERRQAELEAKRIEAERLRAEAERAEAEAKRQEERAAAERRRLKQLARTVKLVSPESCSKMKARRGLSDSPRNGSTVGEAHSNPSTGIPKDREAALKAYLALRKDMHADKKRRERDEGKRRRSADIPKIGAKMSPQQAKEAEQSTAERMAALKERRAKFAQKRAEAQAHVKRLSAPMEAARQKALTSKQQAAAAAPSSRSRPVFDFSSMEAALPKARSMPAPPKRPPPPVPKDAAPKGVVVASSTLFKIGESRHRSSSNGSAHLPSSTASPTTRRNSLPRFTYRDGTLVEPTTDDRSKEQATGGTHWPTIGGR